MKDRSPRVVRVRGTSQVATLDDRSRRRPVVVMSWQSTVIRRQWTKHLCKCKLNFKAVYKTYIAKQEHSESWDFQHLMWTSLSKFSRRLGQFLSQSVGKCPRPSAQCSRILRNIPGFRCKCGILPIFNKLFLVQRYISGNFSWRFVY